MKLEPVSQATLVDTVVERIREAIETNHMAPGAKLPSEADLSASLKVSRNVLREAVNRLESIGLLNVRRGAGMFVGDRNSFAHVIQLCRTAMQITPKDMLHFAEFRATLECFAARRAAELATPEDVKELSELCEEMDSDGLPRAEAIRVDFDFHRKLMSIANNPLMENVMDVVRDFILVEMKQTTEEPRDTTHSRRLHREIFAAIKAKKPGRAEKAMKEHMQSVLERLGDQTT